MHLLAAQPGRVVEGAAVDLAQPPGDIVVLSAADTEIACLAAARGHFDPEPFPSVRLASLLQLTHPLSIDLYVEKTLAHARLIVVRLLGGRGYWAYGVDEVVRLARERGIGLALVPGDDQPDAELAQLSTLSAEAAHRLWQYLVHGGLANARDFLAYAATLIGRDAQWQEPRPLLRAGLYWPGSTTADLEDVRRTWREGAPVAGLLFYRALVQSGNLKPVDALIAALAAAGLNTLPVFVTSLRDPVAAATVIHAFDANPPDVILNATGFSLNAPGEAHQSDGPLAATDCPVIQVIFAGSDEATWREGTQGLASRDITMNVALPEVDGRIVGRAVSFKGLVRRDAATQTDITAYEPVADRVDFAAGLAAAWARLRRTPASARRIAIVLANYPNRDGRLGNGVGLDTPASVVVVLQALAKAGYDVGTIPKDGNALMRRLTVGPTNDLVALGDRVEAETLSFADYTIFFASLPEAQRQTIAGRWGIAERDPYYRPGRLDCGRFVVPAVRFGNVTVLVQPARGYNIDPLQSYHDPDLPPPHHYLATYLWLRETFGAHAVVHMGKHGNLEWLPGKAVALSAGCFPEVALGPLPNLYPFIVNDPGEGTQAKRRAAAVVIDHLTPPLTRAETYGALAELERLVDEYYDAAGVDPRRLKLLSEDIVLLCRTSGLDLDCGIAADDRSEDALVKLDRHLCELKEMQIRDGLHIFGRAPQDRQLTDLLVALARTPRGAAVRDQSLIRALADDLGLGFDPLSCDPALPWTGPRPAVLAADGASPWRITGDTVERLEMLAADLVAGARPVDPSWTNTTAVLAGVDEALRPAVVACGEREIAGLLAGLAGRFVAPGPSGAPTRGRPDVLPTGRNFYSVDTRTVPTPAAWVLGNRSAQLLTERYAQEHGTWPRRMAISCWGTSNMRTGGDDIAQALALLGVRPTWEGASRRVNGFEVLPLSLLDRPRVDVTLRISGFFRDAFANVVELFDAAVRAVAALEEADGDNPLAARVRADRAHLLAAGSLPDDAERLAAARVFGSKPGAYGAGLQALIDERGWETDADLARAYIAWGGYVYGGGLKGRAAHGTFEDRLKDIDAVVQNQDNREHDILDSDDYYQFEGGMTAAVRVLSGAQPTVFHTDHALPERPVIRTLEEEVARVVRARVVNPKWIQGVMRHGYKGAAEMAATVDYLFAFAATARCVRDHHFDAVYRAYIDDETVRSFLADNNPAALKEMSQRLLEAQDRGLWQPGINSAGPMLQRLSRAAAE
ncbi:MAG: cobaltochelatase subunit CobN [Rhodospirillales bacterium]